MPHYIKIHSPQHRVLHHLLLHSFSSPISPPSQPCPSIHIHTPHFPPLPPSLPPSSVQALGGRRSQLVDALSAPTAQDNLYLLNEMARIHLIESFAGVGDLTDTGPEDVILEGAGILGSGSRTSAAAARASEEESPLFYGWASRLLKEEGGTRSSFGGWLSSLWGSKLEEEEAGQEE